MTEFLSHKDYSRFALNVTQKARYIHGEEVQKFLATMVATSAARKGSIAKGIILFRAQRGYEWQVGHQTDDDGIEHDVEEPFGFSSDRMVPKAQFVGDGRVNPKGIPCLYLATDADTAMAEVRPWLGSDLSLAQFKVNRDLAIVDCSQDKRESLWLMMDDDPQLSAEQREKAVWGDINYAFSRPITPEHPATEYVPTQILAEAFRAHGFDGIAYKSLLGKGHNIALFDCAAANLINCSPYETQSVSFNFEQVGNTYFVSEYYTKPQEDNPANCQPDPPTDDSSSPKQ